MSGTLEYIPPEYFTNNQYDGRQATVWSLGCVLYDMMIGGLPYERPEDAAIQPLKLQSHLSQGKYFLRNSFDAKNTCNVLYPTICIRLTQKVFSRDLAVEVK